MSTTVSPAEKVALSKLDEAVPLGVQASSTTNGVPNRLTFAVPFAAPLLQAIAVANGIELTGCGSETWLCVSPPAGFENVLSSMSTSNVAGLRRTFVNEDVTVVPGDAPPAAYELKLKPGPVTWGWSSR